jgi:outer membrane lipoprotein SlyB
MKTQAAHSNNSRRNTMTTTTIRSTTSIARNALFALALAGIGAAPLAAQAAPDHGKQSACQSCGTVISSRTYEQTAAKGSGLGIAGGAVIGGLLGNQVGSGNGKTLATVAGAVGGGYAGNSIEKHANSKTMTDVRVRMSNGQERTFKESGRSRFRNGSRVQVVHGGLQSR